MSRLNEELHDLLLQSKPEGANHDEKKCPICASEVTASQEENVAEAIFSQEQHEQLLATAIEKAREEASAETNAEISRLTELAEQQEARAQAAETKVAELEAQISERDEADRLAKLADERAELVKAAVDFSDEQIENRKMSWATKDEEEFNALLEDYKAAAAAKASEEKEEVLPKSKFDGTRETAGDETGPDALKAFFGSGLAAVQ